MLSDRDKAIAKFTLSIYVADGDLRRVGSTLRDKLSAEDRHEVADIARDKLAIVKRNATRRARAA